jgi:hypothetical protein
MNIFFLISIFLSSISASALPDWFPSSLSSQSGHGNSNQIWDLKNFTTLVTFGDSYTDSSRFLYFYTHNGTAPPAGWVNPPNPSSADGGYPWPVYVEWYSGAKVFNYAVNGASCSNSISPRVLDLVAEGWVYPDVEGYEIGAWEADKKFVQEDGTKFIDSAVDETVFYVSIYLLLIGIDDMLGLLPLDRHKRTRCRRNANRRTSPRY